VSVRILTGDCRTVLRSMADESVNCIVTSPPYFGLRDYGVSGQIGLEPTPAEFVAELVEVFREARRVLRTDGTLWLNLGSSYSGGDSYLHNEYKLREDLSDEEKRDVVLGMFGVRFDGSIEARERSLSGLLSDPLEILDVRARSGMESEGEPVCILEESREGFSADQRAEAATEGGDNRGAGWGMRLLPRDDGGVSDAGPHQRRRGGASESTNREFAGEFCRDLSGCAAPGVSSERVPGAVHELQFFDRMLGLLSASKLPADLVPDHLRGYFRPVGFKRKDLINIPFLVCEALREDGWYLRSSIIWAKSNPMPESVTDRPTSAHENIFLLSRSERYFYDADAVREAAQARELSTWDERKKSEPVRRGDPALSGQVNRTATLSSQDGRNLRNVWTVATQPFSEWTEKTDLVPVPISEAQELCAGDSGYGGDIARITSPNCSEHEGLPDRVPKRFYDGLTASQLNDMRDTDGCLDPSKPSDCGTIRPSSVHSPVHPSTTDSQDQQGFEIASPHSIGTRKTDLAPSSSERAILCEEIAESTERTELRQRPSASTDRDTVESKIAVDSSVSSCEPQSRNDSARTLGSGNSVGSCCCRYYRKVVSKQSHFATFPPALIEPCIKAGCPQGGTVLDPFGGAGTTGLVADRLGRNAVLIELNPEYAAMARRRIEGDGGLEAAE
jgi:DNA modification methylase